MGFCLKTQNFRRLRRQKISVFVAREAFQAKTQFLRQKWKYGFLPSKPTVAVFHDGEKTGLGGPLFWLGFVHKIWAFCLILPSLQINHPESPITSPRFGLKFRDRTVTFLIESTKIWTQVSWQNRYVFFCNVMITVTQSLRIGTVM